MATIPDPMTLSCSSLRSARTSSSPKLSLFCVRRVKSLPAFKGLKVQLPLKSSAAASLSWRVVPRVSGQNNTNIVCEAQETALDTRICWQNSTEECTFFGPANFFLFALEEENCKCPSDTNMREVLAAIILLPFDPGWRKGEVPTVNDTTWKSLVLEADGPVLVEFWAPWCGPCRMIHPVIGELAQQYSGKLKCFKLNTDESRSIATQYGIRSIPTIMIFINGEKKEAVIGAVPKTTLTASIEKFL